MPDTSKKMNQKERKEKKLMKEKKRKKLGAHNPPVS